MTKTLKAAVIGHPVAHSKSPKIHRYWMDKYGIKGEYNAVDIDPNELATGIKRLADEGYNGFNVTVPHKEALLNLCNELDDSAKKIGAVNTVKIENRKLTGYNTDADGLFQNLKQAGHDFGSSALVIGAGGAARAAIYELKKQGVKNIQITNRNNDRAEKLAKEFGVGTVKWEIKNERLSDKTLIINTSAAGMTGKEPLEINIAKAPSNAVVYDIVYAPRFTDLLEQARKSNRPHVEGIGMLLHQAAKSFEIWTGILPEVTPELEKLVLA